jgi:hypothetical protein
MEGLLRAAISESSGAFQQVRMALKQGFDVNGTGTDLNRVGTLKPPATHNRRPGVNIVQRENVSTRDFAAGTQGRDPANEAALNAPLSGPREADPWAVMIAALKEPDTAPSQGLDEPSQPARRTGRTGRNCAGAERRSLAADRARGQSTIARSAVVTFVERFTSKSVSITWRDATAANYCEQLWIRRIARSQGVCALTGASIVRGDAVYGPASRTAVRPTNCAQMVLADALEELEH